MTIPFTDLTLVTRAGAAVLLFLCTACTGITPLERTPERSLTVTSGPDRVFERPVGDILPQLSGATAAGPNGRVGNELVFWGYQLQDGRAVNLFACAILDDVDCEARIAAICPGGGQELARIEEPGMVRHLNCRAIGIARVGDLRPNCDDNTNSGDLLVGLMQCR